MSSYFYSLAMIAVAVGLVLLWVYAPPAVVQYTGWTLALLAFGAILYSKFGASSGGSINEQMALLALAILVALCYGVYKIAERYKLAEGYPEFGYFGYLLTAVAVIVMLAIGWLMFSNQLLELEGIQGLVIQFVFALPCYLAWFAQYLVDDFKNTAPSVMLLLAVELALLAAYLFRAYFRIVYEKIRDRIGGNWQTRNVTTPLQMERVFLNYETRLRNRPLPEGESAAPGATQNKTMTMLTHAQSLGLNQNYRLSVEIYLHPLETGLGAHYSVLRYAEDAERGCPSLFFQGAQVRPESQAVDNLRNAAQLQVFLTNSANEDPIQIAVPLQRWIVLVFYYTTTQVDVFMDGKLVHSLVWTQDNRPVFGPGDKFILGTPMPNGGALGSMRQLQVTTPKPR